MKRTIVLALVASAALCLSGCVTAGQATSIVQDVAPAIQLVAQQDVAAGKLDAATGAAIIDYAQAAEIAAQAYQDASAACVGQDTAICTSAAAAQVAAAAQHLAQNPAIAKLIGAQAGPRVQAAIVALQQAVLAGQDIAGAHSATSLAQKNAYILAALFQLNGALLDAIQAAQP